jgi:hypothetical protein
MPVATTTKQSGAELVRDIGWVGPAGSKALKVVVRNSLILRLVDRF